MRRLQCVRAAVLAIAAVATACGVPTRPAGVPDMRATAPSRLRVRVVEDGGAAVRHVTVEEYVRGSILAEFAPPGGEPATVAGMLEVQAVLSRTFAMSHVGRHAREGYDLCATTHCQLFDPARTRTSRWAGLAARAAAQTAGMVLWFGDGVATALFHADCGGHTSDPDAVWGGAALPYLRGRADGGPTRGAHSTWRYEQDVEAVRLALNADRRTRVGRRLDRLTVAERDRAGRAVWIRLDGTERRQVKGEVLREVLTRRFGARTIRSTAFSVRTAGRTVTFDGRGFGHGVGLCQAGAVARLGAGSSPAAVLLQYFPGTRLVRVR